MWNQLVIFPFTNSLLMLYKLMGSFTLSLILLTVAIRLLLIPLTAKQQKSQMKMQAMQPEIKRIQAKYKGEPERMQKELQKIGYSPASMLAGCLPMFIQFPILIGMYRSILRAIPAAPLQMIDHRSREEFLQSGNGNFKFVIDFSISTLKEFFSRPND
mgnify:CR=1 FL=1